MAAYLQLEVDSNDRFFEKLFMTILFILSFFCQKSADRKSPKKYFHIFVLMSDLGFELGLTPNKLTHYSYLYMLYMKD